MANGPVTRFAAFVGTAYTVPVEVVGIAYKVLVSSAFWALTSASAMVLAVVVTVVVASGSSTSVTVDVVMTVDDDVEAVTNSVCVTVAAWHGASGGLAGA